jgi:DNA-binding XRE family transcriptional regulator
MSTPEQEIASIAFDDSAGHRDTGEHPDLRLAMALAMRTGASLPPDLLPPVGDHVDAAQVFGRLRYLLRPASNQAGWSLGAVLRQAREMKGRSLDELAAASGVTRGALWKLEKGKTTNPRIRTLYRIAQALELPITALV